MSQQSNPNPTDESTDCELTQSERNRFFHGKLMTARDMAAEQRYHRERFSRDRRHVAGYGVVDGLEATVSVDEEGVSATVEPGYALDCCGRPIVVPSETEESLEISGDADEGDLALYLAYTECVTESVPIPGSEDACERECAYNRVVETFSLDVGPAPGREKPVPPVEFPVAPDFDAADEHPSDHPALTKIARSFDDLEDRDGLAPLGCHDDGEHAVYLGQFSLPEADGTVAVDPEPRPRVYTNDMLYSAIARHTADFGNPHDVVATLNELTGDLTITSDDGSISITEDGAAGTIDLADAGGAALRLKALTCAMNTFGDVASEFDNDAAGDLEEAFRQAIESGEVAADPDAFLAFMRGDGDAADILDLLADVTDEFGAYIGGQDHYDDQLAGLEEVVEDGDVVATVVAQLLVCDAARQFSGARVDLGRFFPNQRPGRPLTIDSVIFEAGWTGNLALVWKHEFTDQAETDGGEDVEEMDHLFATSSGQIPTLADNPTVEAYFPNEMAVEEEDEPEAPRVVLGFNVLYVDVPMTDYVEGDVLAPEGGMAVFAVDPEGEMVGDGAIEVDAGEQTFTVESATGIDRLVLGGGFLGESAAVARGGQEAAGLEELRFR